MSKLGVDDLSDTPWDAYAWRGETGSIDSTPVEIPTKEDVAEVLYHGHSGDRWDGLEAAVVRLKDGRLAAWESFYGPTGSGFCEDAYGGDAVVWFSPAHALNRLVLEALTDEGRELCGIPKEGLA